MEDAQRALAPVSERWIPAVKNSMRFIMVFVSITVEVGDSVRAVPESKRRWKNLRVLRLKIPRRTRVRLNQSSNGTRYPGGSITVRSSLNFFPVTCASISVDFLSSRAFLVSPKKLDLRPSLPS
jgi:hypothetical protein